MAYNKEQADPTVFTRDKFELDSPNDLRIIKEFEQELAPYMEKLVDVFGKVLSGYDLYMHENGLYRYSKNYPDGAVVEENLSDYRKAVAKKKGLDDLNWRRHLAKQHEEERAGAIA